MNELKKLIAKCKIKSLYVKWTLLFTGLIIIAQVFTLGLVFRFIVPEIYANLGTNLQRKAVFLKNLYQQGVEITDDVLTELGDTDISFYLLDDTSIPDGYRDEISLNMIQQALDGKIISTYFHNRITKMPFCLVAIGDQIALLTPNIAGNVLTLFIKAIQKSIFMGAAIGSVFIVIALVVVIKPIKKVSQATKEVAKGNFNVALKTTSVDEVGQLIKNFNRMIAELKKNEYLKKDFVSSVSHEFKTPITSIEGFAKLLKSKELTPEQFDDYTDIIIKETARLSNLSSNLLKLSILDSSELEPTKNEFCLDEQIRNIILLLENQWEEKNIEFDIEMEEVLLYGNEELLSQVWINLIQNAIKFSPADAVITIKLKKDNEFAVVTIADQGIGISMEHGDKIFNRFYKADKSRSQEGNGLGLSIVKHIIEISKGGISFESIPGRKTIFFVTLPLK